MGNAMPGRAIIAEYWNNVIDMRTSEYQKLFGLRNKETGKLILYYWASSQKHKAIFSTREKAMDAARWFDNEPEIVEFT